jgi:Zn-dependent metalloprotease
MKKNNYSKFIVTLALLFGLQITNAQNKLLDTEHGLQILDYLEQNKERNNVFSNDLRDIYVKNEFLTKKTGVTHIYLTQRYEGIEIFNTESSVAIKDNKIFYQASRFIPNISQKANTTIPQLSAQDAIKYFTKSKHHYSSIKRTRCH